MQSDIGGRKEQPKEIQKRPKDHTRPKEQEQKQGDKLAESAELTPKERHMCIDTLSHSAGRFKRFIQEIEADLIKRRDNAKQQSQSAPQKIQKQGLKTLDRYDLAIKAFSEATKMPKYATDPMVRQRIVKGLLDHKNSDLSEAANNSLSSRLQELRKGDLAEEGWTRRPGKIVQPGLLQYAENTKGEWLQDQYNLYSVRRALQSAFKSIARDVPIKNTDRRQILARLADRKGLTIEELTTFRDKLDEACKKAEYPKVRRFLREWEKVASIAIYGEKLNQNQRRYDGDLYSMAIVYDGTDLRGTSTSVSLPGEKTSNIDKLELDFTVPAEMAYAEKDSEIGSLGKVQEILGTKLSERQRSRRKVETMTIDMLQESGPCDLCDLTIKAFVKKWAEKLKESEVCDNLVLNVYYFDTPIETTGGRDKRLYGRKENALAIRTIRGHQLYVERYRSSGDGLEQPQQGQSVLPGREVTSVISEDKPFERAPDVIVLSKKRQIFNEFLKLNGKLSDETHRKIKGLSPEAADDLISFIFYSKFKDLSEAECNVRANHTETYFRKLTRIGDTELLYGPVADEFKQRKGELSDETHRKIKGLNPEAADNLISLIVHDLSKELSEAEYNARANHTETYFRKLTRIGDTELLYGPVADEFIQRKGKLSDETHSEPMQPGKPETGLNSLDRQARDLSLSGYKGIFSKSRQILQERWETPETAEMVRAIQAERRRSKSKIPCEGANHMVAQYMFDNVVSRSTPDQANELGHALGMPEFGSKSSREQVLVLVNLRWNLFLGPQENTRSDPTKIHALDRIYIKRFFTSTEAMDPRTELGLNISKIMFSTGSEIRRKERGPEDPFQDEEAKMIRLCLAAAKKIHEAILGVDGIDPNYANWVQRDGKWRKISTAVHKRDIDHRITISDNIIGSDIISIADLDTYSLVNTFFQFKGGLSKYYENTIKQRGKLPPDRINAITQVAVERFEQLQRLRGNFAAEAPEIATTMRRNLLQIRDIDPKKLADNKDVVETYTRLYFERFAKIDPKALADAFVGWDSKYNQWVEKSLVDSGGYSKEDAKDIVEKATQKINSLDANERKNLENSIKKYMQDDEYSTYRQYVLSYVRSFTPMETGELYIQVASNFFDEPGTLPQRLISQAEAKQLEQTIRIRAGIHQAIGGRSQKELITRTEETIRHQTGKNLVDYIRDSLRVEDKLVFSQLCQYGHILQETQGELRSEGPLSLQKTDQLKEAIHLRVNHLDPDTRGKLMSAIREHTGKSQSLKEYVEDCLAELRKP